METRIYDFKEDIKQNTIDEKKLFEISKFIKNGGLVAIPTETVYGLGADGLNPNALKKIFIAKNRPQDNPLILHVSDIEEIEKLAYLKIEDKIKLKNLWPGPLTVILKKKNIIPDEVSAGLDTVAIRIPNHRITRKFIEICGCPIAAPSANLSTKPSPTNLRDTLADMSGKIDAIIDGGDCNIGIESTVLDLTTDTPTILRPGFYTEEHLSKYWKNIKYDLSIKNSAATPKSPGQKYKHYAPNADVLVLISDSVDFRTEILRILKNTTKTIGLMVFEDDVKFFEQIDKIEKDNIISMGSKIDLSLMGQKIFSSMRNLDSKNVELIIINGVKDEGYGLSIMNRLKKSASGNIKVLGGENEDSFDI